MTIEKDTQIKDTPFIDERPGEKEMPVIVCPHCEQGSDIQMSASVDNPNVGGELLGIGFCRLCQREVFLRYNKNNEVAWHYPPRVEKIPVEIEKEGVRKAFEEALRCYASEAPNGALLMCRRALQEAIDDLGAKKGNLPTQLQDLVDKFKITPDLKEWGDHARIGGKLAAHGTGGDEWGDETKVWGTQEDAAAVIDFCSAFFEYIYVLPKRNEERRRKADVSGPPLESH